MRERLTGLLNKLKVRFSDIDVFCKEGIKWPAVKRRKSFS